MKFHYTQTLPSQRAKATPGPVAAVWGYAFLLFAGGSLFTYLGTGSYRLIPAMLVAIVLGGIAAIGKVILTRP